MNYNEINNMNPGTNKAPSSSSRYLVALLALIILIVLAIFVYDSISKNNGYLMINTSEETAPLNSDQIYDGTEEANLPNTDEQSVQTGQDLDTELDAVLESNFDTEIQSIDNEF